MFTAVELEVRVSDIIFSAYNTAFGLLRLREIKHSTLNYLYSIRVVEYMVVNLYCVFGTFCEFKILRDKYLTLISYKYQRYKPIYNCYTKLLIRSRESKHM